MRYLMKQRWLSWGDSFTIQDETGAECLQVQGAIFSWGNQLTITDRTGQNAAEIRQVVFAWGPTYEIYVGGQLLAKVTKEWFQLFSCKFFVDVPGPNDLEAQGDFWDHEYTFRRGDQVVAQVSKQWFAWTDSYGVDVAEGENDLLVLACAVVIDCCRHDQKD